MVLSNAWRVLTDPLAHATNNDTTSMADAFGPELTALLIQVPMNFTLTKLADNIASALLGVATLGYASLGARSENTKHDMLELSGHFFNRALDLRPEDVAEIMTGLQALKVGVSQGNAAAVRSALVRTPEEITGLIRGIQAQANAVFATPGPGKQIFIGQQTATPKAIEATAPVKTISKTPTILA